MTREEQIAVAFDDYSNSRKLSTFDDFEYTDIQVAFEEGAEWADTNPKSPWISVKERLPIEEKDGLSPKVLVLSTKNKVDFSRYDYDVGGWISPVLDIEFTHWSPIPELPKE